MSPFKANYGQDLKMGFKRRKKGKYEGAEKFVTKMKEIQKKAKAVLVMNIEWDYNYYQPWSDNEWLVDVMTAMREEVLMVQNEDITMQ